MIYLAALPLFHLALCWFLARSYVRPARLVSVERPASCSDVVIDHDPHNLVAWASSGLAAGTPSHDTVVILAHGYGSNRDHFVDLIPLLSESAEVVVPAMHGQDSSHAAMVGFGPGEAAEIVSAAQWARSQYLVLPRVVVFGVSLGGSAAWLAASAEPELFDVVITEGAFSTLDEANEEFMDAVFGWRKSVMRPVMWFAYRMGGLDASSVRPVDAAATWEGPSLVIHGHEDRLFDLSHAEDLAEASGAELWLVDELRHAQLAGDQPAELASRILGLS